MKQRKKAGAFTPNLARGGQSAGQVQGWTRYAWGSFWPPGSDPV